jgi:hypothetical protein
MKTSMWFRMTALLTLFTIGIYSAALAITLSGNPGTASPETAETGHPVTNRQEKGLLRFVRSQVGYPAFLSSAEQGAEAEIKIAVTEDGTVKVVEVITAVEGLADYIERRLEGRKLGGFEWARGHAFRFALHFHFVK